RHRSHCCSCVRLFFQRRGDPRALHSFPTRRSSDLYDTDYAKEPSERMLALLSANSAAIAPAPAVPEPLVAKLPAETSVAAAPEADRKSTRLNSSHVKISYAVFCLKKKKTCRDQLG